MDSCQYCGDKVRFVRRPGQRALMVNINSIYFIPDDESEELYVTANGKFRRGTKANDGIKGFELHKCQ